MLVTVAVSVSTKILLAVIKDALIKDAVTVFKFALFITVNEPDTVKLPVIYSVEAVMF